jgi:hypothetical protein
MHTKSCIWHVSGGPDDELVALEEPPVLDELVALGDPPVLELAPPVPVVVPDVLDDDGAAPVALPLELVEPPVPVGWPLEKVRDVAVHASPTQRTGSPTHATQARRIMTGEDRTAPRGPEAPGSFKPPFG